MILGVGIDVFAIKRMNKFLVKSKIMQVFFHPFEIVYSGLLCDKTSYLASCFAAKEAFVKALGVGFVNFNLSDICLLHGKHTSEKLLFDGSVREFLRRNLDEYLVYVSTSIDQNHAIAIVIVESI